MTQDAGQPSSHHRPKRSLTPGFAVAVVLLALAAVLAIGPLDFASPVGPPAVVPARMLDPTPVRQPALEPTYHVAAYTYACSDCHRLFQSPPVTDRPLTQHREIVLAHGINTRCFNCHHRQNRDAFVDDLGDEIPWDQPQLLCAKCHGPVYRDWQHGSHGRTNGYWNAAMGPVTRRKCIECHDPHDPPFPPLSPAPPPTTLRMGPQPAVRQHDGDNPLQIHLAPRATGDRPDSQNGHGRPEGRKGHDARESGVAREAL